MKIKFKCLIQTFFTFLYWWLRVIFSALLNSSGGETEAIPEELPDEEPPEEGEVVEVTVLGDMTGVENEAPGKWAAK